MLICICLLKIHFSTGQFMAWFHLLTATKHIFCFRICPEVCVIHDYNKNDFTYILTSDIVTMITLYEDIF